MLTRTLRQTPLLNSIRRLRDVVEERDVFSSIGDDQRWYQLCSSMDAITDTELALRSYSRIRTTRDRGRAYLLIYGTLQALYLQQDALMHAFEAVGFPFELPESLRAIRSIRNTVVGHPTKRGRKDPKAYGLLQVTISHSRFSYYNFDVPRAMAYTPVVLTELVRTQRVEAWHLVKRLARQLSEESDA